MSAIRLPQKREEKSWLSNTTRQSTTKEHLWLPTQNTKTTSVRKSDKDAGKKSRREGDKGHKEYTKGIHHLEAYKRLAFIVGQFKREASN
ncbi:hypothetical protein IFR04_008790 [Cadophora malorum]|uniref:Uncharacterized protein n=1 Tax=Cadophora malorum TaxID=108018 RepID=A0A8H7TFV5_9HELO|nr:hypothetical protein IFR04_008790 [Cadophora malorum]